MPTLAELKQAVAIAEQIKKLKADLEQLMGGSPLPAVVAKAVSAPVAKTGKRSMSPAARERIAAAQRARWAKSEGSSTSPVAKAASGKRFVSAESRAKMAAAQHARWARNNPSAPANAPKKKGGLSPEGRARIVAALKARHAAAKLAKNGR